LRLTLLAAALAGLLATLAAQARTADPDDVADGAQIGLDTDLAAERSRIEMLLRSPDLDTRKRGCQQIAYSGLTDVALFDPLERQLLADLAASKEKMLWTVPACTRALASSGNPKYRRTVERAFYLKPDDGLAFRGMHQHIKNSLDVMDKFAGWNAIINQSSSHVAGEPLAVTRVFNMLGSGDRHLVREGLKRLKKIAPNYPQAYDRIEGMLLKAVERAPRSREEEDVHAWFCKLLGQSKNPRYIRTLAHVERTSSSEKIRDYAEDSIDRLD
jgi:hypothetical protein